MHISTTAIHIILLSILGGSKTAHAESIQDAFGATNYGFQCYQTVYPKFAIYAAVKHFCDLSKKQSDIKYQTKDTGYRNRFFYGTKGDSVNEHQNSILPILQDGTLYPYGLLPRTDLKPHLRLARNSAGEMVKIDPGPDRLLIDLNCNILGAFSDLDHGIDVDVPRVKHCRVLNSKEDYINPLVRSSPQSSPPLSREPSPGRSREPSPERSH
ncbi:hypothetical protein EPUL_004269 [Erysiphe pulchra]|uniref:Uncharacterized protein n=1 Tax=Erysiphe pulchra TaxID=225359 RepID=A0A2S4PP03_9PEZI|nr:hypothetical protein EPUL_004269 [Erysiphe pulchra]